MTTDEISGKPRVPVGELKALSRKLGHMESERRSNSGTQPWDYEASGIDEANDKLKALIERYDYE